jgi:radical SAM protein with 4Fe4S-binding SPASM domain
MIAWRTPSVAGLELTLRCPCRCLTCGSAAGKARASELTHEEWLDVIATLADLGCRRISLVGGEPLLYARWSELVRAACERSIVVDMVTSGQGLDPDVASRMVEAGLNSVTVSVDGVQATHDRQRAIPDCFEQALSAIRCVDRAGLKVGVTTQVNRETMGELEALAPILEEAGVMGWQLQMTLPLGRAETNQHLTLSPGDMPDLLRVLRRISLRPGLRPHLTDNLGYCTADDVALRTIQGGFPRPWLGCSAGIDAIGITSEGRIKGCLSMPDTCSEGTVRERALADVWNDPNAFAYNRGFVPESMTGACATCKEAHRCRGGCTTAALTVHGRPGTSTHCFRLHDEPCP